GAGVSADRSNDSVYRSFSASRRSNSPRSVAKSSGVRPEATAVAIDHLADRHVAQPLVDLVAGHAPHRPERSRPGGLEVGQADLGEAFDAGHGPEVGGELDGRLVEGRLGGDL